MQTTKKYIIRFFNKTFVLLMLTGLLFYFTSCEEDKVGPPVITNVRTPDPATADSSMDRAFPGNYIVIQGENFDGVTHVYFNDYEAPLNILYATSTNIIILIPGEIPLKGLDPNVSNEIKVVTPEGTAVYNFKFLSPVPSIEFLYFNLPVAPDSNILVYGNNFYEVKQVDIDVDGSIYTITDFQVFFTQNGHIIAFKLPEGAQYNGTLTVTTESGTSMLEFIPKPPPVITGISRDLPMVGDTFTIYGRDFKILEKVVFPGNVEVPASALTVNELATKINLVMPNSLQSGDLIVVNLSGDSSIYPGFNDRSLVLWDYDNFVNGDYAWKWDTARVKPGEEPSAGNGVFYRRSGNVVPNYWYDEGANGIGLKKWPDIPSDTKIENIAVSISVNSMIPWTAGFLKIMFGNAEYNLQPWQNGVVPVNKWVEYKIPLKSFTNMTYVTYSDIRAASLTETVRILINGTVGDPAFDYDWCWDDLRFVVLE